LEHQVVGEGVALLDEGRAPVHFGDAMTDPAPCLTLLTDFGYEAGFVGALHLVACSIAPRARVIDLDHTIPRGDVRLGALRLERAVRLLPPGVHVGVVDPGVGSARRPLALRAGRLVFVGPDNGLLVWAGDAAGGIEEAVVLDDERWFLEGRARTFDGRDVFVPVAAHLLSDASLEEVGTRCDPAGLVRLERPVARLVEDGVIEAEVVQIDGFGNVQLSAGRRLVDGLGARPGDPLVVEWAGRRLHAVFGGAFADVGAGEAVLLVDSDGCLALSVNGGRADALLDARPASLVTVARPR
jgi:S-adenosylmethionine hydrolase